MLMKFCVIYLIAINLLAVILCKYDKHNAKHKKRRVPEKVLFTVSFLGGSIFMYFTMMHIRHKTKHKRFMIGLPIIILLQFILIFYLINLTT